MEGNGLRDYQINDNIGNVALSIERFTDLGKLNLLIVVRY